MIEYVMLEGESSSFKCAHELGKLCENRHLVVNLIPYNATDVKDKLRCPSDEHMLEFRDIVQSYGTFVTVRRTMGADIASACGQLVQKKNKERDEEEAASRRSATRGEEAKTIDIEDVVVGSSTTEAVRATTTATTTIGTTAAGKDPLRTTRAETSDAAPLFSWMGSLSNDDLDRYSRMLSVATTVSATCFLVSSAVYLKKKR
mmetsp:Transcript_15354/g.34849  ORF Transcript_15354/g.34849 Transcript_15354/m.34849 type:complete len:203 (-) Transcript_15354:66-674(-)